MSTLFDIPAKTGLVRTARFNKRGDRRILLTRRWVDDEDAPYVLFCMLNPSTANDVKDDPTIRKCIGFAREWGLGALHVVNLFGFITPSPVDLMMWVKATNLVNRPSNLYLDIVEAESAAAERTVCGWGAWGGWFPERVRDVHARLTAPLALHLTKDGHPGHPLYLPKSSALVPFTPPQPLNR